MQVALVLGGPEPLLLVICAIPKSVKQHRIKEDIDIFDFELTADDVAAIDALDTGVRGGPDPASISPTTYPYKVENN